MKPCKKCQKLLPLSDFYKNKRESSGRDYYCKVCRARLDSLRSTESRRPAAKAYYMSNTPKAKNYFLNKSYGISLETYQVMSRIQGHVCAICFLPESIKTPSGKLKRLSVDHSHRTFKVRGLLCSKCNTALGLFKDSTKSLEAAAMYLKVRGF